VLERGPEAFAVHSPRARTASNAAQPARAAE
jgi:hypothetical protein